jgi:thioredoxin reductase (NADPH)
MRASKVMQQRVFDNEKIEIMWNTSATEIVGDGQVMTGLKIVNNVSKEE